VTPEELQAGDILPTVGETVAHMGRQYECVLVEWERGEDEITVTYRRKYNDNSEVFETSTAPRFWQGQSASLTILDEAATWRKSGDDGG